MTSKFEKMLGMLTDGKWHTLEDIQQKAKLNKNEINTIIAFLKEYDVIIVDDAKKGIRLEELAQRFLDQVTSS